MLSFCDCHEHTGTVNFCEVSREAELTTTPVTVYRYRGAHAARLMRAD